MIFFYIIARRKGKSLRSHGCVSQDVFESMGCSNKSNIIWLQSSDPEAVFDLLLLHERVIDLLARTDDADLFEHINSEWIRVLPRVAQEAHHGRHTGVSLSLCRRPWSSSHATTAKTAVRTVRTATKNSREEVEVEIADEGSDEGDEDDEGEDNHEDE
jgi:hypothetical protein